MVDGQVTLPQGIPELTLGWGVIRWIAKYLKHANGPRAGKSFRVSDSQAMFLLHFYALTSEGRWVYDRAARRWPKGSGKARSRLPMRWSSSSARSVLLGSIRQRMAAA